MADLQTMPVRKWQCSEGCAHLVPRAGRDGHADCTFWIEYFRNMPRTLSGNPTGPMPCGMIPAKRLNGPFTDEPTMSCPHFQKKGC